MTRKLAHIEQIAEIIPIEGADLIVQYRVLNWLVISKKNEFQVGDLVVFIEPDAWVSNTLAPFLTKPGKFPKTYGGIEGERLKTIKLKGALSQGLLLNVQVAYDLDPPDYDHVFLEGDDVTELLEIIKWEPEPEKIPVNAKGSFPQFIPKTDQERVQNFMRSIENHLVKYPDDTFSAEEKAEGSSTTVFKNGDEVGVCSRNLQLKIDDPEVFQTSHFTKPTWSRGLLEKLNALGRNIALQGETMGPGVQGNIGGLTDWDLYVFDIFDIDKQEYLLPEEVRTLCDLLGVLTVPVIETNLRINEMTCADFLKMAHGKTLIGPSGHIREGLVFKSNATRFTFKAVDPEYLIKRGY